MLVIKPYFIIESDIDADKILKHIEKVGRVCYKSEDRMTFDSATGFVSRVVQRGHESVIEHYVVSVRIICDRGISHEIVRHRVASYAQESTRYCNYSKDKFSNQITCIKPLFWEEDSEQYRLWKDCMEFCEQKYFELLEAGATPEEARDVLPTSLKTELIVTMNLREWRHFFSLRCSHHSHPQIREIAIPLLAEFKRRIPAVFDDIRADS